MTSPDPQSLGRDSSWEGVRALVTGFGVSGFAAADTLQHLGATVTVVDDGDTDQLRESGTLLEILGVEVRLGSGSTDALPADIDLVVTSPGWPASALVLAAAAARGIAI